MTTVLLRTDQNHPNWRLWTDEPAVMLRMENAGAKPVSMTVAAATFDLTAHQVSFRRPHPAAPPLEDERPPKGGTFDIESWLTFIDALEPAPAP